ncbi:MAG: Isochorismatase hydrolase [Candidatus Levybacteria bacterium GW2011_GWA2_40_8]|nr:MAG: Isochorismatase hydrolase [Candidatus Levybacteria bacterium GW2011_GWA2_40_8]
MSEELNPKGEPLPFNPEDYSLEEILRPQHSALLVIDMQNDFLGSKGFFATHPDIVGGIGIEPMQAIIPHVQELIRIARQAGVPIIFTKGYEDVKFRTGPGFRRAIKWGEHDGDGSVNSQSGTWGSELHEGIEPQEGDVVVEKHRWSSFDGIDKDGRSLDEILKERGIQTLVIIGVATETCIQSTAQEAFNKDYFVVIPKNSVGSNKPDQHKTVLDRFDFLGDVVDELEIQRAWQNPTTNEPRGSFEI